MPYDQSGNWVDDVSDYVTKHKDATDDEILKQFPKLGGNADNIVKAVAYSRLKSSGTKQEDLDNLYPEFKENQTQLPKEQPTVDNSVFNNKHVDNAIDKLAEDEHQKTFNTTNLHSTSEQPLVPRPYIRLLPSELKQQREAFKEQLSPDNLAGRTVLEKAKDKSNDPDFISKTNDAFATKDWGDKLTPETKANIKSNKWGYDLLQKKPTIQLNPAQAFIDEVESHYNDVNKADWLTSASKEDVIKYEESQRGEHDPNKPIPVSKGWASSVAKSIGGSAAGIEKAILGGEIGTITGGGSNALGALFVAHDAGKQQLGSTFTNVYHSLRDKNATPEQAYDAAMDQGKFNAGTSAVQMGLMSIAGLKLGENPLAGANYGSFGKLLKSQVENLGTYFKKAVPEVAVQSGIAGATQAVQNVYAGKPIDENVLETIKQTAAFIGLLSAAGAVPKSLAPKEYHTVLNGAAKIPEVSKAGVDQAVVQKSLTPELGDKLKSDISDRTTLNKGLPDDVPDDNKQKIQNRLKKIDDLKATIDKGNPDALHPSFAPEVKEKIKNIEEEISELRKPIKNAVQEQSPGEILQRQPEEAGSAGSQRTGMEPGKQRQETTQPRSEEEVDDLMKQSIPSDAKKVSIKLLDPDTGEWADSKPIDPNKAKASIRKTHLLLDKILGCL